MPTDPVYTILPNDVDPEIRPLLEKYSKGLREVVNYGTNVLDWYLDSCAGKSDEAAPPSMLLRHFLEYLDAVSVLIGCSIVEPCKPLLRSAYEALIQLEWMLQGDLEDRSMAYMYFYYLNQLKWLTKHDHTTEQGRQLKKSMEGTVYDNLVIPERFNLGKSRSSIADLFKTRLYVKQDGEYKRLKKSIGQRQPKWYQMWGGPDSVYALSEQLGLIDWYEIFYRQWSASVHASAVLSGTIKPTKEKDGVLILQMRSPSKAGDVYSLSTSMALKLYREVLRTLTPVKEDYFIAWYITTVKPLYFDAQQTPLMFDENA